MKYYVLETTMVKDAYKAVGFRDALSGHMAFVKAQFAEGKILFSGTKPNNSGGVRVLKITDDEDVDQYWKEDPMAAAALLEYRVSPITPLDIADVVKDWFE